MKDFYLKEITLHNYRKFEEKTIQLEKAMNLLIGINASGKTSVLEAANVALGAYLAAYKHYVPSRFVYNIAENDVRMKNQQVNPKDVLLSPGIPQYPCTVGAVLMMDEEECHFKRTLEKRGGRTKFSGNNPMQNQVKDWEEVMKQGDGSDEKFVFPLVLYLSSARLWNENNNAEFDYSIPNRSDAYYRCLDPKRGMQMPFSYIRYLKEVASQENNGVDYPAYTLILNAINQSMGEELKNGERIEYSFRHKGLALVEEDGTWIPFDGLSDGYRGVVKIVADIATRMCILNPYLKENTFEETPGIVIIDELDLSLHPSWQRRIVGTLTKLFPKVQFICASHSPFLIQSLKEGELISMDGDITEEYSGQSIEDIAEDIMGVENPQYSDEKQKMYKLAEEYFSRLEMVKGNEDLENIKNELDVLTARFGENPAYYAFLKQKYIEKALEVGKRE